MEANRHEIKTVTHQVKLRKLTVKQVSEVSASLKRITLAGEDLEGFQSLSPDDHVKVFFPCPGETEAIVPTFGPNGPAVPEGSRKPIMRDYTPLRFDPEKMELDLEFFIHGEGPAAHWAAQASVGQNLMVGGPRGSKIVPYDFDWYLMIGDEASIPSFKRRLAELPSNSLSVVLIEVEDEKHEVELHGSGTHEIHWIHRNGRPAGDPQALKEALSQITFAEGDCFTWIATERAAAMFLRDYLVQERSLNTEWIKATGYWIKES